MNRESLATPQVEADVVPIEHETFERVVRVVATVVPLAAVGCAGWLAWGGTLHWHDLLVLVTTYLLCAVGVTVGYHRLFTHRSFKTTRAVRAVLAVLGSMAIEGPVIEWASTHRKHHRFPDRPETRTALMWTSGAGWRGALQRLAHAHIGWIFRGKDIANPRRYAKDLLADRDLRFISRTFPLWVAVGLALPFGLGIALTGSLVGGLTGLLWGGAVRIFLVHHVTFSINSLCHFFGRRPFATGDRVTQPRLARASEPGGGLAQQPPRLPDLRPPRSRALATRPLRMVDHRARALPLGLGRRADHARAPAGQARRLKPPPSPNSRR